MTADSPLSKISGSQNVFFFNHFNGENFVLFKTSHLYPSTLNCLFTVLHETSHPVLILDLLETSLRVCLLFFLMFHKRHLISHIFIFLFLPLWGKFLHFLFLTHVSGIFRWFLLLFLLHPEFCKIGGLHFTFVEWYISLLPTKLKETLSLHSVC
jgi:hypothetical protein